MWGTQPHLLFTNLQPQHIRKYKTDLFIIQVNSQNCVPVNQWKIEINGYWPSGCLLISYVNISYQLAAPLS